MRRGRWFVGAIVALLLPIGFAPAAGAGRDAPADGRHAQAEHVSTIRYGPFLVPGGTDEDPGMVMNGIVREGGCHSLGNCLNMPVPKPCDDCFITKIVPNLVDATTGETINFDTGGMLHHVVNLNWSQPDATCPPGAGPGVINWLGRLEGGNQRTFASGNERTVTEAPPGYGLRVEPGDDWGFIVDLMNMMDEPRQMALQYTFTWTRAQLKPLTPVWLDVDNCHDSEIDVPEGYSDTHWDWTSPIDGQIIGIGGHVHDNGISIAAENVTRGRRICTSRAGYGRGSMFVPAGPGSGADALHPPRWRTMRRSDHPDVSLASYEGHIAGMTTCTWPRGLPLAAGDTVRLHAQYNTGEMHHGHGVMGIMIAYVYETG